MAVKQKPSTCRPRSPRPGRRRRPWAERLEARSLLAAWVELGPAPTLNGQAEGIVAGGTATSPNNPVVGAVEALAALPGDANTVYAGTANGGVWKTTNATAASPTWTPLTDNLPSTSIGAVAISPLDPNTVYAGSGLFSSFGDGSGGRGLYKSTDAGATWTVANPGGLFTGLNIKSVVPTTLTTPQGQVVLVAVNNSTTGGIFRSTDGGATFARISGNGTSGLPSAGATHLVADPGMPNRFYAGVPNYGVYRTDNGGSTWTAEVNGLTGAAQANTRVELAVHNDPNNDVVYAALLRNGVPTGFFRSTNGGDNWTTMDLAGTNESGGFVGTNPGAEGGDDDDEDSPTGDLPVEDPSADDPGGQGSIHFALLADQASPFVVFVSGDRQANPFPNSIGARDYSGRVFRGDASQPAGRQWAAVTNNFADPDGAGPLPGTSPHADSRDMVFDANGNILQSNDGGIYRLINPNATATAAGRQWVSTNGNLRDTEFHSVGYSHLTHTALGGAQDTGTPSQVSATSTTWRDFLTADGGNVQVDDTSTPNRSIRYTSYQYFGFFNRTTYDANNNVVAGPTGVGLVVNGTGGQTLTSYDTSVQFYQPFELDAVNATRLVIGTNSLYESTNRGDALNVLSVTLSNGSTTTTPGSFNALAYGGTYRGVANPDVLYAGGNGGLFARTTAGGAVQQVASYPGGTPRDVTLDPQNWRHVYVLDTSGRVYASLNAGATWTNVTANLAAQLPSGGSITSMRTITFVGSTQNYDATSVAVGGYGGVYAIPHPGLAGSAPSWSPVGTGLPNTLVYDLRYDATDNVLVVGTLGRGTWLLPGATGSPAAAPAATPAAAADDPSSAPNPPAPTGGADPIPIAPPGRHRPDFTTAAAPAGVEAAWTPPIPLMTGTGPAADPPIPLVAEAIPTVVPAGPLALARGASRRQPASAAADAR